MFDMKLISVGPSRDGKEDIVREVVSCFAGCSGEAKVIECPVDLTTSRRIHSNSFITLINSDGVPWAVIDFERREKGLFAILCIEENYNVDAIFNSDPLMYDASSVTYLHRGTRQSDVCDFSPEPIGRILAEITVSYRELGEHKSFQKGRDLRNCSNGEKDDDFDDIPL